MNRKEMLVAISEQSGCSLRHVRKRIFKASARSKRFYPRNNFPEVLADSSINWTDRNTLEGYDRFHTQNTFDVVYFPSGVIVLFYCDEPDFPHSFGVRLTTTNGLYKY